MKKLILCAAVLAASACTAQVRRDEPVLDSALDHPGMRPEWVRRVPTVNDRMCFVTSSTEGLSVEAGARLAKAYVLASITEMLSSTVHVDSKITTKNGMGTITDSILWQAQGSLRSLCQDDIYWERRKTEEGTRYSVWVLWSMPEKAFYEAQQSVQQ